MVSSSLWFSALLLVFLAPFLTTLAVGGPVKVPSIFGSVKKGALGRTSSAEVASRSLAQDLLVERIAKKKESITKAHEKRLMRRAMAEASSALAAAEKTQGATSTASDEACKACPDTAKRDIPGNSGFNGGASANVPNSVYGFGGGPSANVPNSVYGFDGGASGSTPNAGGASANVPNAQAGFGGRPSANVPNSVYGFGGGPSANVPNSAYGIDGGAQANIPNFGFNGGASGSIEASPNFQNQGPIFNCGNEHVICPLSYNGIGYPICTPAGFCTLICPNNYIPLPLGFGAFSYCVT